jgi:hypothetical protein
MRKAGILHMLAFGTVEAIFLFFFVFPVGIGIPLMAAQSLVSALLNTVVVTAYVVALVKANDMFKKGLYASAWFWVLGGGIVAFFVSFGLCAYRF